MSDQTKIPVTIDTNAWDFLFKKGINLKTALPSEAFQIFIPREVEVELQAIPDTTKDGSDARPLKRYIQNSINENSIGTTATFGFAEATSSGGPSVYAGFGHGTFQSEHESSFYSQDTIKKHVEGKKQKGSGLTDNQADAAVAKASFNSVVLTCDRKTEPIKEVRTQGGKVILLSADLLENQSLCEVVREKWFA